jgi:hypothetical protein
MGADEDSFLLSAFRFPLNPFLENCRFFRIFAVP